MVTHLKGNHNSNGCTLVCESDYPVIDVTPFTPRQPKPGWKDAFPQFTHNVSWVDSDGISQSMTLRSDDLQSLMADLKLLKAMIKAAKAQHAEPQSQSDTEQTETASNPDVQHCPIHDVAMLRRWSKRTQGHYFGHKCSDGTFCYGKAKA
jgi:hypothetical protein